MSSTLSRSACKLGFVKSRRQHSVFVLDPESKSEPIRRTRSLIQGDPSAPKGFNVTLDDCFRGWVLKAIDEHWGVRACNRMISHILFADNFWILARSAECLTKMVKEFLYALGCFGWEVPLKECCWCTTAPDSFNYVINIGGNIIDDCAVLRRRT